jgi:hypothetical protein
VASLASLLLLYYTVNTWCHSVLPALGRSTACVEVLSTLAAATSARSAWVLYTGRSLLISFSAHHLFQRR